MGSTADYVSVILGFVILGAMSVYKLVMMYRSRNDPAKFERYMNQTQVFPERIRRFVIDAKYDEKHPRSGPGAQDRKRSNPVP